MKTTKIFYWLSTGLLSAILVMSAGMYVFQYAEVASQFTAFGYPLYIIYPLALAKIVAVFVLLSQKQSFFKEWAYSALFFEFILAFFAHFMISDGQQIGAVIALVLLITSYVYGRKLFNLKNV